MPSAAAVLFDLDGTLIDTAPDFIRCLNHLRVEEGMQPLPSAEIRKHVSSGARAMVALGFGVHPGDADYRRHHSAFLDLYEANVAVETCLFDGFEPLLRNLEDRGIPWGIVTNKPARFALPLIAGLNLAERCKTLICPDHVSQRKPHPEALWLAAAQLDVVPAETFYVGDHPRDIEAGNAAGMTTVAVRFGYLNDPTDADTWEADYVVDTVQDLAKLLQ